MTTTPIIWQAPDYLEAIQVRVDQLGYRLPSGVTAATTSLLASDGGIDAANAFNTFIIDFLEVAGDSSSIAPNKNTLFDDVDSLRQITTDYIAGLNVQGLIDNNSLSFGSFQATTGIVQTANIATEAVIGATPQLDSNGNPVIVNGQPAVNPGSIAQATITPFEMADQSIGTNNFIPGSVDTNALGLSVVQTNNIATGAIIGATPQLDSNGNPVIVNGQPAVNPGSIAQATITPYEMADQSIGTNNFIPGSVDNNALGLLAIGTSNIIVGAVTGTTPSLDANGNPILDGSGNPVMIPGVIAQGGVAGPDIANQSIGTNHYVAQSVDNNALGLLAVTTGNIQPGAVTGSTDNGDGTFTPTIIAANSVTFGDLADISSHYAALDASSGFISASAIPDLSLTYLTGATAATTYQPIISGSSRLAGSNVDVSTTDFSVVPTGAIPASAVADQSTTYLTGATAATTYQPIISGSSKLAGSNVDVSTTDFSVVPTGAIPASAVADQSTTYLTVATAATTYQPIISGSSKLVGSNVDVSTTDFSVVPAGRIPATAVVLTDYLTSATAGTTYQTIITTSSKLGGSNVDLSTADFTAVPTGAIPAAAIANLSATYEPVITLTNKLPGNLVDFSVVATGAIPSTVIADLSAKYAALNSMTGFIPASAIPPTLSTLTGYAALSGGKIAHGVIPFIAKAFGGTFDISPCSGATLDGWKSANDLLTTYDMYTVTATCSNHCPMATASDLNSCITGLTGALDDVS